MATLRICIAWEYTLPNRRQTSSRVDPLDPVTQLRQRTAVGLHPGRRCPMHHQHDPALEQYPHGRGYGHDYMRGGEVLGGYGYAAREEYALPGGELGPSAAEGREDDSRGGHDGARG